MRHLHAFVTTLSSLCGAGHGLTGAGLLVGVPPWADPSAVGFIPPPCSSKMRGPHILGPEWAVKLAMWPHHAHHVFLPGGCPGGETAVAVHFWGVEVAGGALLAGAGTGEFWWQSSLQPFWKGCQVTVV